LVDPFMETMSQLMEQQRTTPPPVLDGGELRTLGSEIKEALSQLGDLGIPDTLGHLDFNPGNILCSADRCVFVDWAEAYVGPPFLTFDYLRTHLGRIQREDPGLSADLVTAYETHWRTVLSADVVAEAMKVASVLAVFAYATATEECRKPASFGEASFGKARAAGYLRSLTRWMHGEMRRLQDRRRSCIH
jgi:hypothetical protein